MPKPPKKKAAPAKKARSKKVASAVQKERDIDDSCITKLKGMLQAGLNKETGNIALSFLTQDDQEVWVELPSSALGKMIVGLIQASTLKQSSMAALSQEERLLVAQAFDVTQHRVGIEIDSNQIVISFQTKAAISIDFLLSRADAKALESALRSSLDLGSTDGPAGRQN